MQRENQNHLVQEGTSPSPSVGGHLVQHDWGVRQKKASSEHGCSRGDGSSDSGRRGLV